MVDKVKNKTYLRILEKSRHLFNQMGVVKVPVQQIADELLLSPGNVTYHFKKKNDIVRAIVDQLEDDFLDLQDQVITFQETDSEQDLHFKYTLKVVDLLWKYRFVFNNILFLNVEDADFGARFNRMLENVLDIFFRMAEFAVGRGWLKPLGDENSLRVLCENIMHVWLNSLRILHLNFATSGANKAIMVKYVLEHHIALMTPYYSDEHAKAFRDFLSDF